MYLLCMISNVLRIKLHILLTDLLFQLSSSMNSKLSSQRNKIFLTVICERLRFDTRSVNIYISQKTIKHYEFAYRYCNFVCRNELFMALMHFANIYHISSFIGKTETLWNYLFKIFILIVIYLIPVTYIEFCCWDTTHNTSAIFVEKNLCKTFM